jgi:lipoprotein NlpI
MENDSKIMVPVKVNGREATALIDSGASSSVVSTWLARQVGVTPETPGVVPAGCASGIGADIVQQWVAQFESLQIADQVIRDPRLHVSDYGGSRGWMGSALPELILGTDFLRTHRVLVSFGQRKVYFSHQGGQVFPSTPALECDERSLGRGAKEAMAAYDEAIAKDPRDVRALLQRAKLHLQATDAKAALADLDAVLAIEPGNAVALDARARVRVSLGDDDGALADFGAAIANGMRSPRLYLDRATVMRRQGQYERAIAEYDQALQLDPRNATALRARGRFLFHLGRYEAAEKDFSDYIARQPVAFPTIWLGLAQMHRGADGRAALEEGLARLKDGEWPAPVIQHLLGRIDREALMTAAAHADGKKRNEQECEARFYAAAYLLVQRRAAEARTLLDSAVKDCPRNFIEYDSALVELEKMNGSRATPRAGARDMRSTPAGRP